MSEILTIGELARRTGVTTSALRYYDELGLVRPIRRVSGHRRGAGDPGAPVGGRGGVPEGRLALARAQRLFTSRRRPPRYVRRQPASRCAEEERAEGGDHV